MSPSAAVWPQFLMQGFFYYSLVVIISEIVRDNVKVASYH